MLAINKEDIWKAIPGSRGVIERVVRKTPWSRKGITKFLETNGLMEEFKLAMRADVDKMLEKVEDRVDQIIESGKDADSLQAAKFILTSKGKHLGYAEKADVEVNVPLQIQIVKNYGDRTETIDITPAAQSALEDNPTALEDKKDNARD